MTSLEAEKCCFQHLMRLRKKDPPRPPIASLAIYRDKESGGHGICRADEVDRLPPHYNVRKLCRPNGRMIVIPL